MTRPFRVQLKPKLKMFCAVLACPDPKVLIDIHAPPAGVGSSGVGATSIPGVKHIIAIASGKGGVGKSTVAANLAMGLQNAGARVGVCDCDIYGPSISLMFGSRERPMATEENRIHADRTIRT